MLTKMHRALRAMLDRLLTTWWVALIAAVGLLVALLNVIGLLQQYTQPLTVALVSALFLYIIGERASVLDDLRDSVESDKAKAFPLRDHIYIAAASAIIEVGSGPQSRRLLHAALHSHLGQRMPDPPSAALAAFDSAYADCVLSSGTNMWEVRSIFNVTTQARLQGILSRLEQWEAAEGFEVKAFVLPESLPHISILVIGGDRAFLATEDPRYNRVRNGILLHGRESAGLMTDYFESLWQDPRAFHIRRATGIDSIEVNAVHRQISGLPPPVTLESERP